MGIAVRDIKTTMMEKLVHVREMPASDVQVQNMEGLLRLQARVDEVALRITQFKVDTQAVKTACKNVLIEGKAAGKACDEARKALDLKHKDLKAKVSPAYQSQLQKYEVRLSKARSELDLQRGVASGLDDDKKRLKAQQSQLDTLQKEVGKVEVLALPLGNERPTDEAEEKMAFAVRSIDEKFQAWKSSAQALEKCGRKAMQLGMARVSSSGAKIEARISSMKEETSTRRCRALSRLALREAQVKVGKLDAALKNIVPGSSKPVAECDADAALVQTRLTEATAYLNSQRQELLCFGEGDGARDVLTKLVALSTHVESVARKLISFQEETSSRKRAAPDEAKPASKAAKKESTDAEPAGTIDNGDLPGFCS